MENLKFELPTHVEQIISRLCAHGFDAYAVGGCVRDMLLSRTPNDWDITTSARPEEVMQVFVEHRVIETGIKHGTVGLLLDGTVYEITTYRIDGEYEDSRHPKSVEFTNQIEEDLARRDFTINAIAYSEKHGITDPFGGKKDIEGRIIRAVGDAEKRFDEDALRIIRGIRFASTLGFAVEGETKSAMLKKSPLLLNISKERIFTEWKKLIDGESAIEIIEEYKPIIDIFLPEVKIPKNLNKKAFFTASHMARHISFLASAGESEYRLAMRRLKTDNLTVKSGASVISALGKYGRDDVSLAFLLRDLGAECARLLIECETILCITPASASANLKDAEQSNPVDRPADFASLEAVEHSIISAPRRLADLDKLEAVERSGIPYKLSDLAVNGTDLMAIGLSGKEIKEALQNIQTLVLKKELPNEKERLLDYLSNLC